MILDTSSQYIAAIRSRCDLEGRELLEIGCGSGRITRDLAQYARRVIATDPDAFALVKARASVTTANVEFLQAPTGVPDLPVASFDLVLYTLSLHHVPEVVMSDSLRSAAGLLRSDGAIAVIEPGEGGSFIEAKQRFGAGGGDERHAQESAIRAMHALDGWAVEETLLFRTQFQFDGDEDFLTSMLPGYRQQPESFAAEVREFLESYRTAGGIVLEADRRLNLLRPTNKK